ncbi:MAG TPA: hypothetical protein VEA37_03185 [Flavobacterium sp.]|nr:hypothetical protein [Flavobacterium sp.]
MRAPFKPREGKERSYNRKQKREFHESQVNKLPNEFKSSLSNYNPRNTYDIGLIDENDYNQG